MSNMVRVLWGSYNAAVMSGRLSCMLVTPPFKQTLAGAGQIKKQGSPSRIICGEDPDINGALMQQILLPDDGTVLGIRFSKTTNGRPSADACLFVRVRADGHTISINANIPPARGLTLPRQVQAFFGKGDILGYNGMKSLGYDIPKSYRLNFMDEEEIEECFTYTEADDGVPLNLRAQTVVIAGEEKKIVTATPQRRIRVRRS